MEIKGEDILKKAKKTPIGIWIGYIICATIIIISSILMDNKEQQQIPEAINLATNGAIGVEENQYAYLDVQGLTDEVAIYGDTDNKENSTNDRYYIAINNGYWYVVDLNFETIEKLSKLYHSTNVNLFAKYMKGGKYE